MSQKLDGECAPGLPNGQVMPAGGAPDQTPLDVLEYELVQERAAALGRMGRALEGALARLREFDVDPSGADREERRVLVREAGKALWMLVVQREACGLRDSRSVIQDYGVPGEVLLHSGCPEPVTLQRRRDRRRQLR